MVKPSLVTSSPSPPVPASWRAEVEDGLVDAAAADRDVVDVERERAGELERALGELDDVARLGVDERGLCPLLQVGAGLDHGDLGPRFGGGLGCGLVAGGQREQEASGNGE